jgi:hypothetical protein
MNQAVQLSARGDPVLRVPSKCPEKSSLGNRASLEPIGVDSRSVSGKRQTIDCCAALSYLFGIPKKGGRLTELYLDDYALKNGA